MPSSTFPLTLFFDAACPMCRTENGDAAQARRGRPAALRGVRAAGFVVPAGTTLDAMPVSIHGRADCTDTTCSR